MINFLSGIVLASDGGQTVTLNAPPGFENLEFLNFADVVQWGISVVLVLAAVIFFFMLVIGGIKWIMSGGDKGKTEAARNQITAALVGLVIVFASWAILQLVNLVFGVNIISNLEIQPLRPEETG